MAIVDENLDVLMSRLHMGAARSGGPPLPSKNFGERPSRPPSSSRRRASAWLYKTEPCRTYSILGACGYGDRCLFAHGDHELRPVLRHPLYRTVPCRDLLLRGRCTYGERCKYLHPSPFELDQYLLLAQLQLGAQQVSSMGLPAPAALPPYPVSNRVLSNIPLSAAPQLPATDPYPSPAAAPFGSPAHPAASQLLPFAPQPLYISPRSSGLHPGPNDWGAAGFPTQLPGPL